MKTVISASRRTDIPRWFLDDAIEWFKRGEIQVKNPFNQRFYTVSLRKEDVHSIVWWSKDFSRFLEKHEFFDDNYNQYFQFTINGYSSENIQFLEPGMTTSLDNRLEQARTLASIYGSQNINWRFDPVVFWNDGDLIKDNLQDYKYIATNLANVGITRNTISFACWYGKCVKRAKKRRFGFIEPTTEQRISIADDIVRIARELGITVYSCCNDDLLCDGSIIKSSCIDGELLSRIFGEPASIEHDRGQREACGCTKSKDIGSYDMICKHGCLYCYANPKM